MRRILDFKEPGLELVFFDNNRLEQLVFDREVETEANTALCLDSVRLFAELWRPDELKLGIAALEHGGPSEPRRELGLQCSPERGIFDADLPSLGSAQILASIQGSVGGWNRVALPDGETTSLSAWSAVDGDGFVRAVHAREAPPLFGKPSVWLRMEEALPASRFSLRVDSLGDVELRTALGPSFFLPGNDPRPPEYRVRGRALAEWQAANLAIYDGTLEALLALGWSRA
jgi:hypothetical protein